jgi:hypothetical protein
LVRNPRPDGDRAGVVAPHVEFEVVLAMVHELVHTGADGSLGEEFVDLITRERVFVHGVAPVDSDQVLGVVNSEPSQLRAIRFVQVVAHLGEDHEVEGFMRPVAGDRTLAEKHIFGQVSCGKAQGHRRNVHGEHLVTASGQLSTEDPDGGARFEARLIVAFGEAGQRELALSFLVVPGAELPRVGVSLIEAIEVETLEAHGSRNTSKLRVSLATVFGVRIGRSPSS